VTTIDSGSYIAASPAILENEIYVGNYDGVFMMADVGKAEVVWRHAVPDSPILTTPALGSQVVVFGPGQAGPLHSAPGRPAGLDFKALDNVDSSPVICDGKVVFGSDDGRLYMLRMKDGAPVWSYQIGRPIASSPLLRMVWSWSDAMTARSMLWGNGRR